MDGQRGLVSRALDGGRLRLVLDNTIDAVEAGQIELTRFLERQGLDARTLNRVEVVFEEVVSNIIRHGFAPASGQQVHATITVVADAVELEFEDDGPSFNPLEASAPVRPASLEDARPGGLGIGLVRRLASSVRYDRPPPPASGSFVPANRLAVRISKAA